MEPSDHTVIEMPTRNLGGPLDRTLLIVKPHAVERGLVGTFLARFESMGLKLAAIKAVEKDPEFWDRFYPSDEGWFENVGFKTLENCRQNGINVEESLGTADPGRIGRMVKGWLVDHMSSGPSIAVVLQGNEAPQKVRAACGATLPNAAAPGTIRFDFSTDSPTLANAQKRPVYNLVHASDFAEMRNGISAVEYELGLLFPELES